MKILAGSMVQAADTFLHAGYISAHPRGVDSHSVPYIVGRYNPEATTEDTKWTVDYPKPEVSLDMVSALRLKDEDVTATQAVAVPASDAGSLAQSSALPFQLTAAVLFFLAIGALYVVRHQRRVGQDWKRSATWMFGVIAVVAICVLPAFLRASSAGMSIFPTRTILLPADTVPPWEGVALREYAEPEKATLAIIHGLVADALSSVPVRVKTLAQLQKEVGIPSARLTEGQRYALKTYGLDGWGNPLRLSEDGVGGLVRSNDGLFSQDRGHYQGQRPAYLLTSAGPDGTFDSKDDIIATVDVATEYTWEGFRHAFYIRKDGNEPVLLYHRWSGDLFKHNEAERARRMTGTDLFDVVPLDRGADTKLPAILDSAYREFAEGLPYEPVVLHVFDDTGKV